MESMKEVASVLVALEMLLVNLFVIDRCSQRKYGRAFTRVVMGFFVVFLMALSYAILRLTPDFGSGNGLFVACGLLFIIPVRLLYRVQGIRIVTIACSSWAYTFSLFAVSVRLGYIITARVGLLDVNVLIVQTLLYALTVWFFDRLLHTKFIYILENISKKEAIALMWTSIMWFWTVFVYNLSFSYPGLPLLQVLAVLSLAVGILFSYYFIYLQVGGIQTIRSLEKIAYQDELTPLRSRVVFTADVEELVRHRTPFQFIFMDLDNFKSINDRYGHMVGDRYLSFFAHEIKVRLGKRGRLYRVAGDEFVCLFLQSDLDAFLEEIADLPALMTNSNVKFLGFSYGVASYPEDGDTMEELAQCADLRMYRMKQSLKQF